MSNLEKAEYVLYQWADSLGGLESIDREYGGAMDGAAQALAAEGLLAPDLPEPDGGSWHTRSHTTTTASNGLVHLVDLGRNIALTPTEARDLALALMAAANHAEGGKHD